MVLLKMPFVKVYLVLLSLSLNENSYIYGQCCDCVHHPLSVDRWSFANSQVEKIAQALGTCCCRSCSQLPIPHQCFHMMTWIEATFLHLLSIISPLGLDHSKIDCSTDI